MFTPLVAKHTTMRPGEGYLFRRMAPGTVEVQFYKRVMNNAPRRSTDSFADGVQSADLFTNPNAATNMTMIAQIEGFALSDYRLEVYVGDELAAIATPIDSLYFLTIQSDKVGELKFRGNGEWLEVVGESISFTADAHYGTLEAPVLLRPKDEDGTGIYKIIENNHVVIIRNNEKYDITGTRIGSIGNE